MRQFCEVYPKGLRAAASTPAPKLPPLEKIVGQARQREPIAFDAAPSTPILTKTDRLRRTDRLRALLWEGFLSHGADKTLAAPTPLTTPLFELVQR